ncbi:MAG: cytochrome c-type biogenesis protein [Pseudomonadota bacterium]
MLLAAPAWASNPSERLDDPALEERARALGKELRCLVCQNQSIDDSDADFAKDMRLLVRERIATGDSDEEVIAYLVDRYGAFVRLRPAFDATTAILWITPFVVIVLALGGGGAYLLSRKRVEETAALSEDEEKALNDLLSGRSERG